MKLAVILSVALALAGCSRKTEGTTDGKEKSWENAPADDTKKNERDKSGTSMTPEDQGESHSDRSITQKIRQDVVKEDALSMNARNVKIITAAGVVTLRGPVSTEREKTDIGAIAKSVDGVRRVDNQLEVAAK